MNEWEQEEGEGGGVGVGEKGEQTHPILILGQAGVHSCCCSHSRAWIWLGKGSINLLMLQQAAHLGAALRNALLCVCCRGSPPAPVCRHACQHTCVRVCAREAGCARAKHACKHPGEHLEKEVVGSRAPLGRCGRRHLAAVLRLHPHAGACCCRGPVRTHEVGAHVQGRA